MAALNAIAAFHRLGWVHGDVRRPNIVPVSKDSAFLIDLAHSFSSTDRDDRQSDFGMFLCSWLHVPISHRERGWRDALLRQGQEAKQLVDLVMSLYKDTQTPIAPVIDKLATCLQPR